MGVRKTQKSTYDARLLGTWRSDARRTGREIEARNDIPRSQRTRWRQLFGKLELRFTKTRCRVTFRGETEVHRYLVGAKDSSSVVVVHEDASEQTIQHVHFEGKR